MNKLLITGTTSGIGQALVELLQDQYDITTINRRKVSGNNIVKDLGQSTPKIKERYDVFIANAGGTKYQKIIERTSKDVEEELHLNLAAPITLAKDVLKQNPKATIVFISSILAYVPMEKTVVYSAAKAGVSQAARVLRKEYPHAKITCIEIGGVKTPIHAKAGLSPKQNMVSADVITKKIVKNLNVNKNICLLPKWKLAKLWGQLS